MNRVSYGTLAVFGIIVGLIIYDGESGHTNPATGTPSMAGGSAQYGIYIFLGWLCILAIWFMRWVFRYPQVLYLQTFENNLMELKPIGRIVEYPGRTSKRLKMQTSPYSPAFFIDLGQGDSKFDYWDCEIKFKDERGQVNPMIVGKIDKAVVQSTPPDRAPKGWKPNTTTTRTFTPILLSKNFEKFLYAPTQNILIKLNQKLVKEARRDLEQLESNASQIDQQRSQFEELNQRILKITREAVSKPFNTVLQLFCRLIDVDLKEVNQEKFAQILKELKPQDVALQITREVAAQITQRLGLPPEGAVLLPSDGGKAQGSQLPWVKPAPLPPAKSAPDGGRA